MLFHRQGLLWLGSAVHYNHEWHKKFAQSAGYMPIGGLHKKVVRISCPDIIKAINQGFKVSTALIRQTKTIMLGFLWLP